MARISSLFLQKGVWSNRQVINEGWVRESTRTNQAFSGGSRYGYKAYYTQKVVKEFERKIKSITNLAINVAHNLYRFLRDELPDYTRIIYID
ncbi:MAG: hypothetical protein ACFFGZ_10925 [Candidatus Thorarchaeota archaeon]